MTPEELAQWLQKTTMDYHNNPDNAERIRNGETAWLLTARQLQKKIDEDYKLTIRELLALNAKLAFDIKNSTTSDADILYESWLNQKIALKLHFFEQSQGVGELLADAHKSDSVEGSHQEASVASEDESRGDTLAARSASRRTSSDSASVHPLYFLHDIKVREFKLEELPKIAKWLEKCPLTLEHHRLPIHKEPASVPPKGVDEHIKNILAFRDVRTELFNELKGQGYLNEKGVRFRAKYEKWRRKNETRGVRE